MKSDDNVQILFKKYLNDDCSPAEINALFDHFGHPANHSLLRQLIRQELEKEHRGNETIEEIIAGTDIRIKNMIRTIKAQADLPSPVRSAIPLWKWILSSAAVLGIVLLAGLLQRQTGISGGNLSLSKTANSTPRPASERAFFTDNRGKKIALDSSSTVHLSNMPISSAMNTLSTPKGGTYKIKLTDGSTVWLNASSELKYPGEFSVRERKVFLKGEAFFQVSKDTQRPFRVVAAGKTIEVLGTSFNVNAYSKNVQATLVEGSIKILNKNTEALLRPGEEALISENTTAVKPVNIEPNIAWKKGDFYFQNDSFREIMKEVERWYDIQVTYTGTVPNRNYVGSISRKAELSEVLEMLKEVTGASFKLKDRNLQVIFN